MTTNGEYVKIDIDMDGKAETSVVGVTKENHDQMSAEIFKYQVKVRTAYRCSCIRQATERCGGQRAEGQRAEGPVDLTKPQKTNDIPINYTTILLVL
jgi:hypothetical protein